MSQESWLKSLLQRISKSSIATPRKRPAFSPVRVEILEDRNTPVALDWTGAAGTNWNTPGNWVQNQVPSAANNVLNFSSATPGVANYTSNNDIAGLTGFTINITDANAASNFTITGLNVGVTSVTHNKTDNQATSTTFNLAMTGAGATLTNTAGALTILNVNNVFDTASNVNVPTGANLTVAVFPSSSVGNAKFNLTGGTLTVAPDNVYFTNAFNVGQNATANNIAVAGTPLASLGADVQLYPMMADISRNVPAGDTQFQTNTRTWGNNNTYFYSGEIFFPNTNGDGTGSIAFAAANDDSSVLFIDGVQYFSFNNNTSAVSVDPTTGGNAVTLPTGWHTIDLRFGNGGGGSGVNNNTTNGAMGWVVGNGDVANPTGKGFGYRVTDSSGSEVSANPLDAKNYRRLYASPSVYGINAVTQSGNTVTVTSAAPNTTNSFNSSVKVGDKVELTGVTPSAYNGIWTVATVSGNTFTFAHPQSGLGNGTVNNFSKLTLPDDGARLVRYGINAMSESGTTVTVTTSRPGATTAIPSGAHVGDRIVISGATPAAYNGTWEVTAVTGDTTFTFEHTTPGLAALTQSAANTSVGIPDDGVRVRVPKVINAAVTNAVSVSGNSTIALQNTIASATLGNLTMASGATLNVVANNTAGQTLNLGTASLAGNVTISPAEGATLILGGAVTETAASGITKTGAGTLSLASSGNTYSGITTINAGTVVAGANGALGGAAAGTVVASGGQLVLGANYTNLEALSLAGPGSTATNGALAAAVNATYAGPITLTSNARIAASANTLTLTGGITIGANDLTFAGAGTVTVGTTGITGAGKIAKVEGGTAILNVANPGLTGDINVNAGTLRASVDGALGTVAGITNVGPGATLRFVGNATGLNYATLEPINIIGQGTSATTGAINITGGNVTLAAPIKLTGTATIGSGDAGSKLTLSGPLTIPLVADLNFTGAGNIDVVQGFGNGSTPAQSNAALFAQYLHDSPNRTTTDRTGVGAAPGNQGLLVPGTVWEGNGLLKGPYNFADPGASPGTTPGTFSHLFNKPSLSIDAFSVYFTGQINVTTAGTFTFASGNIANLTGLGNPDTATAVYIDKNKNHIFEDSNTEMVFVATAQSVSSPVTLGAGTYDILLTFDNGTGTGGINISYSTDGGSTYQIIDPSRGVVAGASFTNPTSFAVTPSTNVNKTGAGVVTLLGNNTYNGTTTINAGALVAGHANALGSGPAGTIVKSGGTLGFTGGVTVANEAVTFNGAGGTGQAGAVSNISGNNTFTGTLTAENLAQGTVSVGSSAGTLTLNGAIDLKYSKLIVGGAGDVVINSALGGVGTTSFANGIAERIIDSSGGANGNTVTTGASIEERRVRALGPNDASGILTTQINYTDAQAGGAGVLIAARSAELGGVGLADDTWTGLWVTTFTAKETGAWEFRAFAVDDNVGFFLDLDQNGVFDDSELFGTRACCGDTGTFVTPTLTVGQKYLLGIQLTDTGGGGIIRNAQFRSPSASAASGPWVSLDPSLPANNGVFQVAFNADNSLIKNGAGTLTLNGANTYNGNTTINGGTVNYTSATAYGGSPTSTLTVTGATTVVNLFNNATATTTVGTADFGAGAGTVNTGVLGGKLAIKNTLKLGNGYTVTGNMTAQGASLADNAAQRTLSAVSGALAVSHTENSVISLVNTGTLFTNSSNQNNNLSFTAGAGSDMLIVAVSGRSSTLGIGADVTFGGVPMLKAATTTSLTTTAISSEIFYLPNPTTGTASSLAVNFNFGLASNYAVYAFTLKGVDPTATPISGVLNTEGSPISRAITLNGVAAGSWGVTEGTYRNDADTTITSTATSGTSLTTGTGGTTGNFWRARPTDNAVVDHGALVSNLAAGSTTFTSVAGAASATRWTFVAAAFAPKSGALAINLPATNIELPNGTSLSVNGPGDAVLGSIAYTGNVSISGVGAIKPTSLTIGGGGATGVGTLAINDNLGLKLATGSTYKVDVNGATAGQFDQTNVSGAVNLNGAALQVTSGFTPAPGNSFTIISNDGTDAVVGAFAGLPQGATVVGGAGAYTISYTGGDGNDVVLTATTAGAATTTTLVAAPLATTGGSSVQFTATVAPSPGALGTVTFLDNGSPITGGSNIAVANGVAVFSTTTLAVGTHPVTAAYSGAAGFAPSTSAPQSVVISSGGGTAPSVASVDTNVGVPGFTGAQHSRVVNLTVVFDQAVQLDADAMTMALHANNVIYGGTPGQPTGTIAPSTLNVTGSTDKKTWTITFDGLGTVDTGGDLMSSLKEGVYDLKIDKTKVHPLGAATVNMAADSVTVVHRLYGDVNGASQTSATDFAALDNSVDNLSFRNAFNKTAGNAGYVAYLDLTGDGTINSSDNLAFRQRFNKTLSWSV